MVYVLDTEGKPLMPTERHGKVRRLLRDGKACVVRLQPFTIQLTYESKKYTQEVSLGIDAGSVHIGVSATTEKKELFSAEEKAQKKAAARENNKKILDLIARKQDEALEKKSIKDLEKMLESEDDDDEEE